jgi:pimeloyl-ACP methyl ester carboxylesterase
MAPLNFSVPVILNDGSQTEIAGDLCLPTTDTTVFLFLHGFTYARYYWDLHLLDGSDRDRYSFVVAANKAGFATCNIDRLGVSFYYNKVPLLHSYKVALENHGSVVNQVIQKLRLGKIGDTEFDKFEKIVLVGHSYGSTLAFYIAGRYQNVDLMVITGMSHMARPAMIIENIVKNVVSATSDPKFHNMQDLDYGYLTTNDSGTPSVLTREVFYYLDKKDKYKYVDEMVIQTDENNKDLATDAEMVSFLSVSGSVLDFSKQINIPTFFVNGQKDPIGCPPVGNGDKHEIFLPVGGMWASETLAEDEWTSKTLADFEKKYYFGPNATVGAYVVENAGHNVTLHRDAQKTLSKIFEWVNNPYPGPPPTPPSSR